MSNGLGTAALAALNRVRFPLKTVVTSAPMLLAYPALSGQFLVNIYSDQYVAGYSFREFGAQVLRATGGFALWNPYLFGGLPYVGAMHGDIFYPTALIRMVMPTDAAMTWGMILHFVLGGYATYVFLRALGLRFGGAVVGAVAYMLSGWNASYVNPGHDGKISSVPCCRWQCCACCEVCAMDVGGRGAPWPLWWGLACSARTRS
ncbi:MAG: hypothetical protein HC793_02965 [Aquincola sp.]|nr:hypothetical protein [Aquincola sp.]